MPLIMKVSSISNTLSAEGLADERAEAIKGLVGHLLESTS
jgi:hypothetical protein